jgi:hypothetical protein
LRAIETCICSLRCIQRNMRAILRTVQRRCKTHTPFPFTTCRCLSRTSMVTFLPPLPSPPPLIPRWWILLTLKRTLSFPTELSFLVCYCSISNAPNVLLSCSFFYPFSSLRIGIFFFLLFYSLSIETSFCSDN